MTQDLFPQHWLTNTLFDDGFIAQKLSELAGKPLPYDLHAWLSGHFDVPSLAARNEAQLEEKFIMMKDKSKLPHLTAVKLGALKPE